MEDVAGTSSNQINSPSENVNSKKNSITCENVPESLFDPTAAKKHFSKFGRVQKIRFFPKRRACQVDYELPTGAEKAVLNAGAYDGFMFDVTRSKPLKRRRSKKEDDPEWLPDSAVEEELSAMSNAPIYRIPRQQAMEIATSMAAAVVVPPSARPKPVSQPVRKIISNPRPVADSASNDAQPAVNTQTSMSTSEAASELYQLSLRVSITADDKWRALDVRDKIIRCWGGSGSRVRVGGATIGTCPDMCPEKERLHRQAEHQVMSLEGSPGSDGALDPRRAVKQYSRSSADQEMPMCYELRPPAVLMRTATYLLRDVVQTDRQLSLADWFHFLWDRLRSIRKDITQQALCCADSISLVEICARFHAHCAARLADLEHTQFDQKLNTDNLTKCLQTLKHMYADVSSEHKPREAEFRGYIALLNLGDANFWWEIKQLPREIQKSKDITFAIKVFNAIDNNNYVRFFRLVKQQATYLQACILLRYFNDVRARALSRIVKAFAPRGGSRYPAHELINSLAFESLDAMKAFVNHYGLRIGVVEDTEVSVILDRHNFFEDSDPYPISRAISLIESKRKKPLSEVICGGPLPMEDPNKDNLYNSFNSNGTLRFDALIASDQGYDTVNDTNKNVKSLKAALVKLCSNNKNISSIKTEITKTIPKLMPKISNVPSGDDNSFAKFAFKPAIPVASAEIIKTSPEKIFADVKNMFSFSKPQEFGSNVFRNNNAYQPNNYSDANLIDANANIFKTSTPNNIFKTESNEVPVTNVFIKNTDANHVFIKPNPVKFEKGGNIFSKADKEETSESSNIFGSFKSDAFNNKSSLFSKAAATANQNPFANGDAVSSPRSLFKSALNKPTEKSSYSIFQTKNIGPTNSSNIFSTTSNQKDDVYDFNNENDNAVERQKEEYRKMQEEKIQELKRQEAQKLLEEQEKIKLMEEKKQNELKKRKEAEEKLIKEELMRKQEEAKKKAELEKRLAEEKEKIFLEKVNKESSDTANELVDEINNEFLKEMLQDELNQFNVLMAFAGEVSEELTLQVCSAVCESEIKSIKYRREKLCKKWFSIWKHKKSRNLKRRSLLQDTPVWLPAEPPERTAVFLRRSIEQSTLKSMNAFHRGYQFTGIPNIPPPPEPYNIIDLIKSPLLKRMKQLNYPYDKCFFWKLTILSPGSMQYMHRKININQWIMEAFGDGKTHIQSNTLIRVGKYSWNNIMDFAVSVSLADQKNPNKISEALEGSNGLLIFTVDAVDLISKLESMVTQKYQHQVLPVAIVLQKCNDANVQNIENLLLKYINKNVIYKFKLFIVEPEKPHESMHLLTKNALKWLTKNYPAMLPLEIDYLKSICQRNLGNELWCRLKLTLGQPLQHLFKDIHKLVDFYNAAVDKLTEVVADEELLQYPNFASEFTQYLDQSSPYPKPMEFITSNIKTSENIDNIKRVMQQLKLPNLKTQIESPNAQSMQDNVRSYCEEIGCFDNPEEVVCKVIAVMPNDITDDTLSPEEFQKSFEQYDMLDLMTVSVHEKISNLEYFDALAMYDKNKLDEYTSSLWLYDTAVISKLKHKTEECIDDLDYIIDAKRRKLGSSMECLMLEDSDTTLVEENIKLNNLKILHLNKYKNSINEIEESIERERMKSIELENVLRHALNEI